MLEETLLDREQRMYLHALFPVPNILNFESNVGIYLRVREFLRVMFGYYHQ